MISDLSALRDQILRFKEEKRAVILSHNYQRDEVQEIADFVGDSLELSRTAATLDCAMIVFCGVHFMAESASILSPEKTVLLPEREAGCPMADMIRADAPRPVRKTFPGFENPPAYVYPPEFSLKDIKKQNPGVPVVAYVNTTAEVKAESDICCTSANVVRVIESLPGDAVICVPDKNLSMWAAKNTRKKVIAWDGYCNIHERVTVEDIGRARREHPQAVVMAHPECRIEVLELADHVTSTSGMLRFATASPETEFVVGTEIGLLHRLRKETPNKVFYPLRNDMVCPNMKKTTLQSILRSFRENTFVVNVPEHVRIPAKLALDRMLRVA
ncbi:MAG: quinolinate synthase [Nitrospirae bacterium]|nr:quinolinate synthase [Nitrospirota bacterium]